MIDHTIEKGNKRPVAIQSDGRPSNRIRLARRTGLTYLLAVCLCVENRSAKYMGSLANFSRNSSEFHFVSTLHCRAATRVANERGGFLFNIFYEFRRRHDGSYRQRPSGFPPMKLHRNVIAWRSPRVPSVSGSGGEISFPLLTRAAVRVRGRVCRGRRNSSLGGRTDRRCVRDLRFADNDTCKYAHALRPP